MTTLLPKLQFFGYRCSTIARSFKTLYTLPPEKIEAFLDSYEIFNHDWEDETKLIKSMGSDYYKEIQKKLVNYYSVLNHLCALGQVEKMYIPPAMDLKASIIKNQSLFEQMMARDLGLKPGMRALDIGCGRGRVASHIAKLTGAMVTGMNLDLDQLASAKRFATVKGLSKQCQFIHGDLNQLPLPFPDASLDALYHIQVFCYSKDLQKLFNDIYRVLKPGSRFACLDWVSLANFNSKDPHHDDLMRRIKPLIGAIGTPSVEKYTKCLENAGFKVLVSKNPSIGGTQASLIDKADKFYTRVRKAIELLVKCKVLPKHFSILLERLTRDGQAFVEADRKQLVTSCYYLVAEKI